MTYTILAVGKLKETWWQEAVADYLRRLAPYAQTQVVEVPGQDKAEESVQQKEAAELVKRIPSAAYTLALDGSSGQSLTSRQLAGRIDDLKLSGHSHLCFLIGGATGLHPSVLARADEVLSLGPQTWPHNLVRVMLTEQLYRAARISANHPYHK